MDVTVFLSPWMRCACGKLHVVTDITRCPACGRVLNPWDKES